MIYSHQYVDGLNIRIAELEAERAVLKGTVLALTNKLTDEAMKSGTVIAERDALSRQQDISKDFIEGLLKTLTEVVAERDALRKALEPFGEIASRFEHMPAGSTVIVHISIDQPRAARSLLSEGGGE